MVLASSASASTSPYGTPGPYTTGVWLIAQNGQGAIVDRTHLPKEGSGFAYYWLGATYRQAAGRLLDAMTKLGIRVDANTPTFLRSALLTALGGGVGTLNKGATGILGAIQSALQSGVFGTGPVAAPGVAATGGADAAAGGAAAGGAGAGVKGTLSKAFSGQSSPDGSAADAFATPGLAAAAAALAGTAAHTLSSSQAVDLGAGWFTDLHGRVLGVFAGLMLLALLVTIGVAAIRGDSTLLLGGFTGVAEAVALTFMVGVLTAAALVATDQLSTAIAGPGLQDAQHMLYGLAALLLALASVSKGLGALGHVGLAHAAGTGAWGLSFLALIALGLLVLDLTLRSVAIYAILLILPLAAAARAWPNMKVWSTRLLKVLFALVTLKLLLTLLIAMGAGMFLHGGLGGLWLGTLTLLVVGLSPIALYGLVGWAEHGAFHGRHVVQAGRVAQVAGMRSQTIQNRREEVAMPESGGGSFAGTGGSFGGGQPPADVPAPKRPSGSFGADLHDARHEGRTRRDPYVADDRYSRVQEFDRDLEEARRRVRKEDA